jgi:hypothetical protein
MSKILAKLIQERRSGAYRKVDGMSGRVYSFRWEPAHRAYVAELDQSAADDLFAMPRAGFIAPVVVTPKVEAPPVAQAVEIPAAEREKRAVLGTILETMGITAPAGTDSSILELLMHAYDKGRASVVIPLPPQPPAQDEESPGTVEIPPAPAVSADSVTTETEDEPAPDTEAGEDDGLTPRQRAGRLRAARRKAERSAAGLD